MESKDTATIVDEHYDSWFVPGLSDFVRVPNLTMMADNNFATNGLIQQAMECVDNYINKLDVQGLKRHVFHPEGSNPLVVYVIDGSEGATRNVMLYGHLDKQPWGAGWEEGLAPNDPQIRGDYMYGRGSSDDGYSAFATMLAVKSIQLAGGKLPRVVLVLETEEESGSPNLIPLLNLAEDVIGKPDACFCMDSGALDYDQLWLTSSLRGVCNVDLTIEGGKVGYHSGETGGIIPETFRVARALLNRLDNCDTGRVTEDLQVPVPDFKQQEADSLSEKYGDKLFKKYNLNEGVQYINEDNIPELYLNKVWRPNLSITGAEGLPPIAAAGNVLRPKTTIRCSMRLCPAFDAHEAEKIITNKLTTDVPYNAKVTVSGGHAGNGWCQKHLQEWLHNALTEAGHKFFGGKDYGSFGEGGSIPFLNELQKKYPDTQIVAMGLVGPGANIHGPNENINLVYAKKLVKTLAHVINQAGTV
ncbi:peptidase m20 [Stylonychia lemnae]|uniref:Peptidase m20 n=1 Tax=Stylonychia lemnae TaxID=5949 RepID=A0A078AQX4_STYLE|nr:peptidase m20 [Stylonychia lemnae]|eukprot:CDW83647.1 peptidase m20 [Stylonychia lemnae]